jgi:hypothetical protein
MFASGHQNTLSRGEARAVAVAVVVGVKVADSMQLDTHHPLCSDGIKRQLARLLISRPDRFMPSAGVKPIISWHTKPCSYRLNVSTT